MNLTPLWISLKTATLATIVAFVLGIFCARWMAFSRGRGKWLLDGIFILPLVLPPTVLGFLLLVVFGKTSPIGHFLSSIGITVIFTWPATVITGSVAAFPLMYRSARGAFEQVDTDLLDAARTLGVSEWEIFWRVTIPLAWPGIAAGTILAFSRALGEFGATLMLAGNIPNKTQTIPIAIYFAMEGGNQEQAAIWVFIIMVISLVAILGLNYWSKFQQPSKTFPGGR
ncbi:molybdate ABC transporter permease subunit [Desulfallas sp. Bu1-1]|uniref:molybdate ABC transporter permease subunit n=1 Tax=Desulfallas sp. Bu1-1 TaxID=2787620 RepID=UPI00189F6D49|nr:molybdate ABC transporter permease subunit [Desulfallas sp. Bu1-1]MBF7084600.1 molybdate ABC transporter permease subunit [Desulfallas sp. Bu1-1]